jgi:uncharacterized protein (DUF1697 family)
MTWIALLRGINLAGHRRVLMAELRAILGERGLENVRTLIQSGNVVFESSHRKPDTAAAVVRQALLDGFGHDVDVIMRTPQELGDVVASDPFAADMPDGMRVNVTFLAEPPAPAAVATLEAMDGGPERVRMIGRELYMLRLPRYGESVFTQAVLDRHLGKANTTRNMDVVRRILHLATGG